MELTNEQLKQIATYFQIGDNELRRDLNDRRYAEIRDELELMRTNDIAHIEDQISHIEGLLEKAGID